jgi:hypothetical protein
MLIIYSIVSLSVLAVLLDEIGSRFLTAVIQAAIDKDYIRHPVLLPKLKERLRHFKETEAFVILGAVLLLTIAIFVEGVKGEGADDYPG